MNRTSFLLIATLISAAPLAGAAEPAARNLNILVLYADDWRHDTLGVAGNPVVQTPSLDRLASQGVRFTHNVDPAQAERLADMRARFTELKAAAK